MTARKRSPSAAPDPEEQPGEPGLDLEAFGTQAADLLRRAVDAPQAFFYHFALGSLAVPAQSLYGYPIAPEAFIEQVAAFKPPLTPATLARHGPGVYRASDIMQWHREEMAQWSENYRLIASAGGAWGLTALFMDGEVLLGVAGVSRGLEAGDYTQADLQALREQFPALEAGFHQACRVTRERLLGRDAAAVMESHPNGIFLFDQNAGLLYANRAARLLMQNERPGESDLPMDRRSTVVATLRRSLAGELLTHPAIADAHRRDLQAWGPERRPCTLFVVNANPGAAGALSRRQREILEAVVAHGDLQAAAAALNITMATLRTHLRNLYRQMGASGLDEALALYHSGGHRN